MPDIVRIVSEERLIALMTHLLEAAGMSADLACRAARVLATADMRGIVSHGVRLLPGNIARIRGGAINPRPAIHEVGGCGAMVILDGDHGLGMAVGSVAMDRAIELAREHGIGWVNARNTCHYGASGSYVMMAVETGMIGVSISNTLPMMSIEGTISRTIGNNPLAIGVPGPDFPLVLDMATSVASLGKIGVTRRAGRPIPGEWLTQQAAEGQEQVLRHFGGAKGSGLAIMTEVLTGVLAGGCVLHEVRFDRPREEAEGVSYAQVAIRPDVVLPKAQYEDGMRRLVAQLKAGKPGPDITEVLLPGERAWRETLRCRKEGIPIEADVAAALEKSAAELGTSVPWE